MVEAAFSRSPLLGRIDAEDLRALARAAIKRTFAPGEILFLRGDAGDGVFAIIEGGVRVFVEGGNAADVIVATRGRGDVLGEMSLLDGLPRSASARAVDAVTALYVSNARFEAWLQEHPAAAIAMLQVLSRRLREVTDQVAEIALLSVESRVARRLWQMLIDSTRNGEPLVGASLRVNQSELASSIGVTRESVNKHLARLKQSGVIEMRAGRVTIVDVDGLRALGEEL